MEMWTTMTYTWAIERDEHGIPIRLAAIQIPDASEPPTELERWQRRLQEWNDMSSSPPKEQP